MRGYIIPWAPDHVLIDRDYSQQELRILAHFEDDPDGLQSLYGNDPWTDIHNSAKTMINDMLGTSFPRKIIKNIGFGLIYGMGVGLMAVTSGSTVDEAREAKAAYLKTFPGIKDMNKDMKTLAREEEPLVTWGGREYYCEPARMVDGRRREFDYKMLNVLIQGSAADCTKQAIINYAKLMKSRSCGDVKFYLNVHDELMSSVPRKYMMQNMAYMGEAMEDVEFDIPMLTEGTWSPNNWADLKPYDVKGELKYEPEESRKEDNCVEPLKVQKVRAVSAKRKAGVLRQDQRS
jgi:DNA polymerase I-like protein with 3'-5' exonuclease and polymerase domains